MGGDDREQGDQDGAFTVTWGKGESHGRGVTTSDGAATVTVSHSESRTGGCHHHEDDRTMSVAWATMAAEDGGQIRGIVLTELARLLAEAPGAVTLDGGVARGKDLFFTLRVPRALLSEVIGTAGTSVAPHLVVTKKGGTSET